MTTISKDTSTEFSGDRQVPDPVETIRIAFAKLGDERYGSEGVTQLQHALQTATLAIEAEAPRTLVVAALLHDIGHILAAEELPQNDQTNLDDRHEERPFTWLRIHFGEEIAAPVRLHVLAKRYLCSTNPSYLDLLSPTSRKSFYDQGGMMTEDEIQAFRENRFYEQAIELRLWDDRAKDPKMETPTFDHFVPDLQACRQR